MDGDQATDMLELQRLKARYFRYLDTKQWSSLRELFTDDFVFFMENAATPTTTEPIHTSGDDFVETVSTMLQHAVTVHHGHMPEIELTDDGTATGVWAMYDWVDDPVRGFAIQGSGHYHERYVKGDDGRWRIAEMRLTRLRVDSLEPSRPDGERPWPPPWSRHDTATA